jgi:hypothetical protein
MVYQHPLLLARNILSLTEALPKETPFHDAGDLSDREVTWLAEERSAMLVRALPSKA